MKYDCFPLTMYVSSNFAVTLYCMVKFHLNISIIFIM
jgi:hypothetical protein